MDDEEQPDVLQERMAAKRVGLSSITAPKDLLNSIPGDDADVDPFAATRRPTVD